MKDLIDNGNYHLIAINQQTQTDILTAMDGIATIYEQILATT